ncbi:AAA family ATPase [Streptomyces spinoverrucosus]|uniref:AAA family ATPase n=1 Tax=Streptomyces spinoverrucosus TaxID=284043 RepID=UPI0018C3B28F|nr:AAA family ATPase [Streptomyces spinoverrucosus]
MADAPRRVGLMDRHALVAALDLAARQRVTIISAPAGSRKTSVLRAWAAQSGQQRRIAFVSVRGGQNDAQLFWLDLIGAIRGALDEAAEPPAASPAFDGTAMVDRVLSELATTDDPITLIIDDLHWLSSPDPFEQLASLPTHLPRQLTRSSPPAAIFPSGSSCYISDDFAPGLALTPDSAAKGASLPRRSGIGEHRHHRRQPLVLPDGVGRSGSSGCPPPPERGLPRATDVSA